MKSLSSRMKTKKKKKGGGGYKDETRKYVYLSMLARVVYWQSPLLISSQNAYVAR